MVSKTSSGSRPRQAKSRQLKPCVCVTPRAALTVKRGAKAVTGGKRPSGDGYSKGNFYLPTVLIDVDEDGSGHEALVGGDVNGDGYEDVVANAQQPNGGPGTSDTFLGEE